MASINGFCFARSLTGERRCVEMAGRDNRCGSGLGEHGVLSSAVSAKLLGSTQPGAHKIQITPLRGFPEVWRRPRRLKHADLGNTTTRAEICPMSEFAEGSFTSDWNFPAVLC